MMHLQGEGLVHNNCWGIINGCKRPHGHGVRSAVGAPSIAVPNQEHPGQSGTHLEQILPQPTHGNWEPSLAQHRVEAVGPVVLTLFEPGTAGANFAF